MTTEEIPHGGTSATLASPTPTSATLTTPIPATGETPAGSPDASTSAADDVQQRITRMEAALKKANAEAKSYRLKADELDKLKADTEAATLSETDTLKKQLATLQQERDTANVQAGTARITSAVQIHAVQLGIDPKLAVKLLDHTALEFDADGTPSNIADALKALVKEYGLSPRAAQASGGATNPSRTQSTSPQNLSWDVISKMTPAEYAARQPEIQRFISEHTPSFGRPLR